MGKSRRVSASDYVYVNDIMNAAIEREFPSIRVYCDKTIIRVVFGHDLKREPQWFFVDDLMVDHSFGLHNITERSLHDLLDVRVLRRLPIEEWLAKQEMKCVEDDIALFTLTWR